MAFDKGGAMYLYFKDKEFLGTGVGLLWSRISADGGPRFGGKPPAISAGVRLRRTVSYAAEWATP